MPMRSAAALLQQRPAGSVDGHEGGPVGSLRTFVTVAPLALVLHLLPLSAFGAAPPSPGSSAPPPGPVAAHAPAPAAAGPKIVLAASELPATGLQKTLLTVDRFGRYSLKVENAQGSSVELVDKMAGSLGRAGTPGGESGRLDLFLDRGQYQVRVESAKNGTGKVKVSARGFRDRRPAGAPLAGGVPAAGGAPAAQSATAAPPPVAGSTGATGATGAVGATAPRLIETRLVTETLDDLEQISFWVEIGERRGVRLEAAGRDLADLRLWRDGSWLDGAEPHCQAIQPVVGQPLYRCRLATQLEPGLYLLTAYGGAGQPWSEAADAHPLYLRWGEPRLPESGRRRYVVSPFGEDHLRLPDNVNFFRLELPEARPATLAAGWLRDGSDYDRQGYGNSGAVTKESLPPATEVRVSGKPGEGVSEPAPAESSANAESAEPATAENAAPAEEAAPTSESPPSEAGDSTESGASDEGAEPEAMAEGDEGAREEADAEQPERSSEPAQEPMGSAAPAVAPSGPRPWELVATITGTPGQAYVLQHFEQRDEYTFNESGPHWVSSVHAGAAEDSVDATALVTDRPPGEKEVFLTAAAIPLDLHTGWSRRFNFQAPLTLFLEIKETGVYRVLTSGADARVRVEPFLLRRPEKYAPPDWKGATSGWSLDRGYYVLSLEPQKKGILTLILRPGGKEGDEIVLVQQPVQAAVRFAPLVLDPSHRYTAYFNHQPAVTAGMVIRPWPVDLDRPLPVAQKPGEAFEIPFHNDVAGTLRAEPDDGSKLEISLDGGAWAPEAAVASGDHKVAVRHNRPNSVVYSLWVEPAILQASTPLPPLPDAALNALPKLPLLTAGAPRYVDLERGETATYLLQAEKPGLYAVRSTGLLATAGTLRTRTVPELRRDAQNGVGRNFVVQQYLREGDYQVAVAALGASRGHAGLALEATQLLDGGELRAGLPGHYTLPAGQAVVFKVAIAEAGRYTLRALGLGFKFLCRFEDADGWPLERPNLPAELDERLEAGSYRFVLLPQPVETRALVLLERRPEPLTFKGHGPHPLPLETSVEHLWVEPEGPEGLIEDAPRPPDVWQFELPAPVHAAVELSDEMQGTITRLDAGTGAAAEIGAVPPGRAWKGELAAGRYQVAAVCSRRNSRVRYRVVVHTDELVTGLEKTVAAPGTVQVSLGREGLAELTSIAPADVRARLLDGDGRVVAENDDRPDDWNFLLFQRLPAGRYTLRVEPVGVGKTDVRVALRTPAEVQAEAARSEARSENRRAAGKAPAAPSGSGDLRLGSDVLLRPVPVDAKADLLLVAARSKDSLGLSVERREKEGWRALGTSIGRDAHLEIALAAPSPGAPDQDSAEYRLRLWSLDRHETPVRLSVAALAAPRIGERELRRGAALAAVKGFDPPLAAAAVDLDRPGVFRFGEASPELRGAGVAGVPLAALGTGSGGGSAVLSAPGARFWLVREGRGTRPLKAERVTVGVGLDAGVQLPVPDGTAVTADLGETGGSGAGAPGGDLRAGAGPGTRAEQGGTGDRGDRGERVDQTAAGGPVLALVTAPAGQPGVRVAESGPGRGESEPAAVLMAVGPRTALAVGLAVRQPVARVWQAGAGDGESGGTVELRLAQLRFAPPQTVKAEWGVLEGRLDGIVARRFDLPPGPRKLRLALGEATVAVLSRGDAVVSTHWQGGMPFEERVDDDGADRLTLLHTRPGSDPYTVELLPRAATEEALALALGAPFERDLDRAGTLRIALPDAARGGPGVSTLHVRGGDPATTEAIVLGRDGSVARGADLPAGRGGVVLVRHGPGLLLAWLGGADDETAALWPQGDAARAAPIKVAPPASVPLTGRFAELTIAGTGPRVLHLRTAQPLATLLHRSGGPAAAGDEVEVHPEGGRLDAFLPPGETRLGLRALAGAQLSGVAEITETPVVPIGEGLGPEVLLPAGGSRWFSFRVERQGPVGIGAHADSDVVEIELYDRSGRRLDGAKSRGRGGVVGMPELAPGDYLLALRSPSAAAPVKARPALAGLVLPDTGPPAEVIRQYLQEAGAEAAPESVSGSQP